MGNPGARYAGTRHNIGCRVVERLAERWHAALTDRRDTFEGGAARIGDAAVYLAIPRVYMNLSGQAARALSNKMGRMAENLIVVHDDVDLPLGRVRLKIGGGDGGQKGVRSIAQMLGDRDFYRVKVGVGRPDELTDMSDHVLSRFTPDEAKAAEAAVECAADAVELMVREDFLTAQNRIHTAC
ncbi:MAG: aminoacyl-tRNA hydrolase [Leptospirillia bacterium]